MTINWPAISHWVSLPAPCLYCGTPTRLRFAGEQPAHQVCARRALTGRRQDGSLPTVLGRPHNPDTCEVCHWPINSPGHVARCVTGDDAMVESTALDLLADLLGAEGCDP